MTRKDFILISSAIRATQERINDQLPHQNASFKREEQLRGVRRAAGHLCDALSKECGKAFDTNRFLNDCGYGAAERGAAIHIHIEDNLRPLPSEEKAAPTEIYDCGICGHYHRAAWNGDCREDDERFTMDEVEDYFGNEGTGWVEVPMPEEK